MVKLFIDANRALPDEIPDPENWIIFRSALDAMQYIEDNGLDSIDGIILGNGFGKVNYNSLNLMTFISRKVHDGAKRPNIWVQMYHDKKLSESVKKAVNNLARQYPKVNK